MTDNEGPTFYCFSLLIHDSIVSLIVLLDSNLFFLYLST